MIRPSAALCVIAFAATLSACKPETPPVASAVPGLLIDCDLLKPRSLDGNAQANCRQPLPDSSGMSASFQFADTADGQRTGMVGIAAADDTPEQTITYPAAGTVGLPLFLDLDSDGRADMLVPQPGEDENVPMPSGRIPAPHRPSHWPEACWAWRSSQWETVFSKPTS